MRPYNIDAMLEVAHAMSVSTRFKFSYGIAYELNDYTADGTVFDYMSGVRQVRLMMDNAEEIDDCCFIIRVNTNVNANAVSPPVLIIGIV